MYEIIILTLLMQTPAHGYLIIKVMNDIVGPFTKLSHGRLYPLLAKLEADGLIAASQEEPQAQESGRHFRTYEITEEGRKRFHELMMDTISNPGEYQKLFSYKVQGLEFLPSEDRLFLLDHYTNFCQAHILYLVARAEEMERRAERGDLKMSTTRIEMTLNLVRHAADQWRVELDWVTQLRLHLVELME